MLSVITLAVPALLLADGVEDMVDPRTRTFVNPKRVVWSTPASVGGFSVRCKVSGTETLLRRKFGQVPENGWGKSKWTPCVLENNGNVPGLIIDFGRELHGGLQLGVNQASTRGLKVRIRLGESVAETLADAAHGERGAGNDHAMRDFLLELPVMGTRETGNSGFRFAHIELVTPGRLSLDSVRAISLMRNMEQLGSFKSSDERLNRVYETAVRTVHLCCQEYLWDGIKRDRLVWMGDTHPETMAILKVFGAATILPESLDYMAATTSPDAWMNTMPSYTLWWIRNIAEWYRYTGDKAYVAKHAEYIRKTLDNVEKHITPDASWNVRGFLDWPTQHNSKAVEAGMQALAVISFEEAAFLFGEIGDRKYADKWHDWAMKFRSVKKDPAGAKSAAAMLALSGNSDAMAMYEEVLGRDGHDNVSTFYGYYMLEAMSVAGENQRALDTIRDYWGAMLDVGATSFWEDFNLSWTNNCFRIDQMPIAGKKDIHGDYGEFCYPGFRHSLCHGWSCGPAPWCISHILGIKPLTVGCTKIEVRPFLGDLEWAEGSMALPRGKIIRVRAEKAADGSVKTTVDAPPEVEIVR